MLRSTFLLPLLALAALACSGSVATAISGGTTSGSGGATGAASTGTAIGTSGVTTSGTAASSSGGTGASGCGTIELSEDNGAPQIFPVNCESNKSESATTAVGWYSATPVQPMEDLNIVGCATAAVGAAGITLLATGANGASGPGTYDQGSAQFTDDQGSTWSSDVAKVVYPVSIVVTASDGQVIDGTFAAGVGTISSSALHKLSGSFHVCHGPDFFPP
jgi:hypothetical protein